MNTTPTTNSPLQRMGESAMTMETSTGNEPGFTAERSLDGTGTGDKNADVHRDQGGLSLQTDGDGGQTIEHERGEGDQKEGDTEGQQEGGAAEPTIKLPDFDPAKPEAIAEYDKAFVAEGGSGFNLPNLSTHFFEHAKVDWDKGTVEGGLPESTKKYLNAKGIDNATIDAVIRGQIADAMVQRQNFYKAVPGGQAGYAKAIEWATKGGGYTQAQRDAFNKAIDQGGQAREDAIEALMSRASKANPKLLEGATEPPRVTPKRSASDGGGSVGGGGADTAAPYESLAEWRKEFREAKAAGDQAKFDQVRKRYAATRKKGVPGFI